MVCEAIRSRTCVTRIPETAKAEAVRQTRVPNGLFVSHTHTTRERDRASPHHGGRRVLRMVLLVGIWSWDWLLA